MEKNAAALEESGVGGEHAEVADLASGSGRSSAWRRPTAGAEEGRRAEGSVMGAESWPALEDARQKGSTVAGAKLAPAATPQTMAEGTAGQVSKNRTQPPPAARPVQGNTGQCKSDGFGNGNPPNKYYQAHIRKHRLINGPLANGAPPFPVPLPCHQAPGRPMLYPVIQPSPFMVHEFPYRTRPLLFSTNDIHSANFGHENPMAAFVQVGQPGGKDGKVSSPQLPRGAGDPKVWRPSAGTYGSRPHSGQTWGNRQPFDPRYNTKMPHGIGPRTFVRPTHQFFGPPPGFSNGPPFPGPPMYYLPAAPMEMMRGPSHFVSHQPPPAYPVITPDLTELRTRIVNQIEYYFSDQNLHQDTYLRSLLDEQGWISISKIADFPRMKRMTDDIPLILDALGSSSLIEIQEDKIRRRSDWCKWLPVSTKSGSVHRQSSVSIDNNCTIGGNNGGISSESIICQATCEDQDEHLPSVSDYAKVGAEDNLGCNILEVQTANILLACDGGNDEASADLGCGQFEGSKTNEICGRYCCSSNTDSLGAISDSKSCSIGDIPQEIAALAISGDLELEKANELQSSRSEMQNLGGFCNGSVVESPRYSVDQGTFMLDEELALEQMSVKKNHLCLDERFDEEEDEMDVIDQDTQRQVIMIQGLQSKCSGSERNNCGTEMRNGVSKPFILANPSVNSGNRQAVAGNNGCEETAQAVSRRRQYNCSIKMQAIHKQCIFPSNLRSHNIGHNCHDCIRKSPN